MDFMSTAQLLGNIGEFFGAIAVVVTLGYLTVQLRQNTRSINSNNSNMVMPGLNEFNTTIFSDPELVRVFYDSRSPLVESRRYGDLDLISAIHFWTIIEDTANRFR